MRELEQACASLQTQVSSHHRESETLRAASRRKDEAMEEMLREVTQSMRAEIGKSASLQRELEQLRRHNGGDSARGGGGGRGGGRDGGSAGAMKLEEPLQEALEALPAAMRDVLCVDAMLAVHGDAVSASPHLLLPSLIQLTDLHAQREALASEASALRIAQADAVRKLAATNAANSTGVVGNAASFLRGAKSYLRPDKEGAVAVAGSGGGGGGGGGGVPTRIETSRLLGGAEIAKLRDGSATFTREPG